MGTIHSLPSHLDLLIIRGGGFAEQLTFIAVIGCGLGCACEFHRFDNHWQEPFDSSKPSRRMNCDFYLYIIYIIFIIDGRSGEA